MFGLTANGWMAGRAGRELDIYAIRITSSVHAYLRENDARLGEDAMAAVM